MMEVDVVFSKAPPLAGWQKVLTPNGWKITKYNERELRAKNAFGESTFPARHSTRWQLTIEVPTNGDTLVRMEVPAFAESAYAENRMLEKIADLAEATKTEYEVDGELYVDVLTRLRERHDRTP